MNDLDRPRRIRELAAEQGVSTHQLYRWVAAGQLRHFRIGKSIFITAGDFRAMLDRHAVEAGQPRPADPIRSEAARQRQLAAEVPAAEGDDCAAG